MWAFIRSVVALVAGVVTYYLTYVAITLAWFGLADANIKIGPSDLGVPEILFHLVSTGLAAATTGLVVGGILTRRWAATWRVVTGTVAATLLFVAVFVLGFQGQPDQGPSHTAVAVIVAVILGAIESRRAMTLAIASNDALAS